MQREIIVEAVFPPIPFRDFDYCAITRDYEPSDPQGYGATAELACADLKHKLAELKEKS